MAGLSTTADECDNERKGVTTAADVSLQAGPIRLRHLGI